jgi:hypothetical protein
MDTPTYVRLLMVTGRGTGKWLFALFGCMYLWWQSSIASHTAK